MKNIIVKIFILIPILISAQEFKIAEPNVEELKAEMKRTKYAEDVIYLYLNRNFDSIAKKREVIYYNYPDFSICSFNQDFENGINYSIEQCREAGGISVSLTLPKTEKKSLVEWVERIFKSSPIDIEHGWNKDKSKFEPTDKGVGCYFEIKETERNTIVENYCGC